MSTLPLRPTSVEPRRFADLLALLPDAVLTGDSPAQGDMSPGDAAPAITGVTHDSTAVRPGDLYLARAGARAHGAAFAADAARAGAVAVLTDDAGARMAVPAGLPTVVVPDPRAVAGRVAAWVYGEPATDLLLLGVTGTNGKTTTSYLLEAGLRAAGHVTGLIGTVETRVAGQVVPSVRTTPEATDLQALLAVMRERGVTAAAMEVSSHALALGRVSGTRYAVAAFTNLSQDHLDFHADLEDYFAAKASLFTPELAGAGVLNVDDPYGARLARAATIPTTTVATVPRPRQPEQPAADWWVGEVEATATGSRFRLDAATGATATVTVRLPGAFNVANAAQAVVTLALAGVPLAAAVRGVGELAGVPGRMERVDRGQPFAALVDYAHTPEALRTALTTLRAVTSGRLAVVVGCGGDRDSGKRPLMGAAAAAGADLAILTDDNPRSEESAAILAAMLDGVDAVPRAERAEVLVEPDRRQAIRAAVGWARPGDTVLVAGKGHETGQEARGVVTPFDDRVVLAEALDAEAAGSPMDSAPTDSAPTDRAPTDREARS